MKIRYSLLLLLFATSFGACKKYLDDAYTNPNAPVIPPPAEQVLPAIIGEMHRGVSFDSRGGLLFTQYMGRTFTGDNFERMGYITDPGSADNGGELWRMHYYRFGHNILNMIKEGNDLGKFDYAAVAYTILAWGWLNIADYHGEMILDEAFNKDQLSFSFQGQEKAYPHVIKLIDSAMMYFDRADKMSTSTLAVGDQYLYGGDLSKWRKFANGVKAKAYHRYYNKGTYTSSQADSVIKYAGLSMASVADDANVKFVAVPNSNEANFYGPVRGNMQQYRPAAYLVNLMNGVLYPGVFDPRTKFLFRPSTDGVFRGVVHNTGDPTATAQKVPSLWGIVNQTTAPAGGIDTGARSYFKNASPFPLMTYSELQFIKAEAEFKKGSANALQTFKTAIGANFDALSTHFTGYYNFTAAERDNFINNAAISGGGVTLKNLMRQKFVALYPYGWLETWVDLRKHNYDTTNIYSGYTIPTGSSLFPDNLGKLIYRMRPRYNSEYLWNFESLDAIGGRRIDYHTKKVWFSEP